MVLQHGFAQQTVVKVGIDLGSGYAAVAEHYLNKSQVHAMVQQMGSKSVPQGVRTNNLRNSSELGQFLEPQEHPLPADFASANVQK